VSNWIPNGPKAVSDPDGQNSDEIKLSRRRFIATSGVGVLGAEWLGERSVLGEAQAASGSGLQQSAKLPAPIKLPRIQAETERETGDLPNPFNREQRLGFAIVGLGHLALEQILPAFGQSKRCKPVALVSGDPDKARRVADQYSIDPKNLYNYTTYDRIKDNPEVDIIYIVLPNSMHAEYTIRGAQAGKHILCEKPMATTVKESEQMIAACKQANKKLMIAYRIQYEPHNRAAMEAVRGREIGKITAMTLNNGQNQGGDLNQWRLKKALSGGGSLPDVGVYCLNTARFLTGEEPHRIVATTYTTPNAPRFKEVEETVSWTMQFPSGVQANCAASYGWHQTQFYRVLGSDAMLDLSPAFSYAGIRMHVNRKSPTNPQVEQQTELVFSDKQQFALEMDHMAECVVQNKTPYTPGEEGLQDMRLMAAIYEAARTNRAVKMPLITTPDTFRGAPPTLG
jgi:predicted dehydrogenase